VISEIAIIICPRLDTDCEAQNFRKSESRQRELFGASCELGPTEGMRHDGTRQINRLSAKSC